MEGVKVVDIKGVIGCMHDQWCLFFFLIVLILSWFIIITFFLFPFGSEWLDL